jgi:hypothetical protein
MASIDRLRRGATQLIVIVETFLFRLTRGATHRKGGNHWTKAKELNLQAEAVVHSLAAFADQKLKFKTKIILQDTFL